MTRNDVVTALIKAGLFGGDWHLEDDRYDPVSPDFVAAAAAEWVRTLPDELKERRDIGGGAMRFFPRWLPEVFDCDNLGRDFAVFLDRCMAVDAVKRGVPRGNSASGVVAFSPDSGGRHLVNWMVSPDGTVRTFDAGVLDWCPFTATEKASISDGNSI